MRKTRLKEKDTDKFLGLEDTSKGALLVLEQDENYFSFRLTPKQVLQIREWCTQFQDDFFKKHKITSKTNARKKENQG